MEMIFTLAEALREWLVEFHDAAFATKDMKGDVPYEGMRLYFYDNISICNSSNVILFQHQFP